MSTLTSSFGLVFAFASKIGSRWVEETTLISVLPLFLAPAARGAATTSTATSAVTRPRPPLPHSAFDRESPPRFPVPHRALERCSPDLPLPLIQSLPLRLMRAAVECRRPYSDQLANRWISFGTHRRRAVLSPVLHVFPAPSFAPLGAWNLWNERSLGCLKVVLITLRGDGPASSPVRVIEQFEPLAPLRVTWTRLKP